MISNGFVDSSQLVNNMIGKNLDDNLKLIDDVGTKEIAIDKYDYDSILKDACRMRPEFRQMDLSVNIAEKNLVAIAGGWLPSIYLQGNYGWNNSVYANAGFKYDATNWQVVAAASWDIFDGFGTQAKISEAKANLDVAKLNKEIAKKTIELEVKQAYLDFITAKQILNAAKKGAESARENYDVSNIRYENGLATNIEMLDAYTALVKAENDLLSARYDLILAKAKILKASGVLDINRVDEKMKTIVIEGIVRYIDLEGGFVGLVDESGNKYDLSGSKVDEILKGIDKMGKGRKIKVQGVILKDRLTFHMWGQLLEVKSFEWQ